MELGLFQEQKLKLNMTTELRQAINILQYSSIELVEFIQEQALENPIIEVQEPSWRHDRKSFGKGGMSEDLPTDFEDVSMESLQDVLLEQLQLTHTTKKENEILKYMIYLLDENGYLIEEIAAIAEQFSVDEETVTSALETLQRLEPAGVGARNLRECLYLQLQRLPKRYALAELVVKEHLTLFAERKWKAITKMLDVTMQDLQEVFDFIQTLNPKPGAKYSNDKVKYVSPDLIVEQMNGEFKVILNDSAMPTVTVNDYYYRLLSLAKQDESFQYMKEKYERFIWLRRSIEQRRQTLLKVMTTIVERQNSFFNHGEKFLKPLTLKDVAEEIDVHESTVSRATNGKYVQTPFGLYELKFFFTSSIQSNGDSEAVSSELVKKAIQELIDNENKKKPYSDQKIVDILKKEKTFDVSRRTIAKYREQLKIPSSSKRKRFD